jgi:ribosome biogenesis GTPase A
MLIGPDTPGYIAPEERYPHVPNYDKRPVPKAAPDQHVKDSEGTMEKIFVDVRNGRSTILYG